MRWLPSGQPCSQAAVVAPRHVPYAWSLHAQQQQQRYWPSSCLQSPQLTSHEGTTWRVLTSLHSRQGSVGSAKDARQPASPCTPCHPHQDMRPLATSGAVAGVVAEAAEPTAEDKALQHSTDVLNLPFSHEQQPQQHQQQHQDTPQTRQRRRQYQQQQHQQKQQHQQHQQQQQQQHQHQHPQLHQTRHQQGRHAATVDDERFMRMALDQAHAAFAQQEVPVGTVIVAADGHTILAASHNQSHALQNPVAHAEVQAISCAAQRLGGWRLLGATLYTTLEPCPMCAGAILQARLGRLVYAARQPRLGADGSWVNLFPPQQGRNKHRLRHGQSMLRRWHRQQQRKLRLQQQPVSTEAVHQHADTSCDCSMGSLQPVGVPEQRQGPGTESRWIERGGDRPQRAPHVGVGAGARAQALQHPFHNQITVTRGVLQEESAQLLRSFFRARRAQASGRAGHKEHVEIIDSE